MRLIGPDRQPSRFPRRGDSHATGF